MSKFFQAFLTGIFFTFLIDFFLFLGIKLNYINHYDIDVYYNILFADHQNIFVYLLSSLLLGFIIVYISNKKVTIITFVLLFILSLSSLIPFVGYNLGELLLMKKDVTLKDSRYTYVGNIYYIGRKNITFYDKEIKKIIILDKKELIK